MAAALVRDGAVRLAPPHGTPCRVRLLAACGRVDTPDAPAVLTITLGRMIRFIEDRLALYRPILSAAQFGDPVLGLLKLIDKLGGNVVLPQGASEPDAERVHRE